LDALRTAVFGMGARELGAARARAEGALGRAVRAELRAGDGWLSALPRGWLSSRKVAASSTSPAAASRVASSTVALAFGKALRSRAIEADSTG
jgi:hypothetical protein